MKYMNQTLMVFGLLSFSMPAHAMQLFLGLFGGDDEKPKNYAAMARPVEIPKIETTLKKLETKLETLKKDLKDKESSAYYKTCNYRSVKTTENDHTWSGYKNVTSALVAYCAANADAIELEMEIEATKLAINDIKYKEQNNLSSYGQNNKQDKKSNDDKKK